MVSRLGASLSPCTKGKGRKGFKSPNNRRLIIYSDCQTLVYLLNKKGSINGYTIKLRNAITVLLL